MCDVVLMDACHVLVSWQSDKESFYYGYENTCAIHHEERRKKLTPLPLLSVYQHQRCQLGDLYLLRERIV